MAFFVYKITNMVNGKVYIGKTNNLKRRWNTHKHSIKNNIQTYIARAIRKYGSDSFDLSVIEECEDENLSYEREIYWIKELNSTNSKIGYNITEGGLGGQIGVIPSKETREKIGKASRNIKRNKLSKEQRENLKKTRKNQQRIFYTIELKNEILTLYRTNKYTKQQLADKYNIKLNTIISIIFNARDKEYYERYSPSQEVRDKLKLINLGKKQGVHSKEHKEKISKALQGKIPNIDASKYKTNSFKQKSAEALKRHISDELKLKIINEYDEGKLIKKELAEKYSLPFKTIKYITGNCKKRGYIFLSKEQRKSKKSKSHSGKKLSDEHKRKIGEGNKEKKMSEESKRKISLANSGENNGMYNNTHSDETKKKMSESQSKRVRKPLSEEHKQKIKKSLKGQKSSAKIPIEIKESIKKDYSNGNVTKKQLAEKYYIKYNTIVSILYKR